MTIQADRRFRRLLAVDRACHVQWPSTVVASGELGLLTASYAPFVLPRKDKNILAHESEPTEAG